MCLSTSCGHVGQASAVPVGADLLGAPDLFADVDPRADVRGPMPAVHPDVDASCFTPTCTACGDAAGDAWTCSNCPTVVREWQFRPTESGEEYVDTGIPADEHCNCVERCEHCENCSDCCDCVSCDSSYCSWRGPSDGGGYCSDCERCSDCCHCWTCPGCNRRRSEDDSSCSRCECCDRCCDCVGCESCHESYSPDDVCGDCNRCNDCGCECEDASEDDPGESTGRSGCGIQRWKPTGDDGRPVVKFHKGRKSQAVPSARLLAVEIEVSRADDRTGEVLDVVKKWGASVVGDGSLGSTGSEIPTAPASGGKLAAQLTEICGALRSAGAGVDSRCGLHCHADARDFTWADLHKLIRLYARVEEGLFSVVARSRRSSEYCVKCGPHYLRCLANPEELKTTKGVENAIKRSVYGTDDEQEVDRLRQNKYEGLNGDPQGRYAAMNLHSWFFRGTVENRMHHGSTNPEKILQWAQVWAAVLDWAKSHSEEEIAALPADSFACLLAILPTEKLREWCKARRAELS